MLYTWNFDPVAFSLGSVTVYYYGIFFAVALGLAYILGSKMAEEKQLSSPALESLFTFTTLGLIIGARLGHVFFYEWSYYSQNLLEIPALWNGGLASHGGVIGTLAGAFLWKYKYPKENFYRYADIFAVLACLPMTFVRLGNWMNSEIVGRATSGDWGVILERVDSIPRHPSQLYEAGLGLTLLVATSFLWKKNLKEGSVLFFVLPSYFLGRFLVEFFKDTARPEWLHGFSTGQLLSVVLGGLSLVAYARWRKGSN